MHFAKAALGAALAVSLAACGAKTDASHESESAHADAGHGGDAHAGGLQIGPADAHAATNAHAPTAPHGAAHGAAATPGHWAYSDQGAWANVAAQNATCASGIEQSPINLTSAGPNVDLADLTPRYLAGPGAFLNNGHTLQFTPANASSMLTIGADAYQLVQFHFHSPSEHLVDRKLYPLELHLVHRNQIGQLAVVGVFIEQGPPNPALDMLVTGRPTAEGDAAATQLTLDPTELLPADHSYYAYAGSLTTPPCSEGVRWNVLRQPITASAAQIAALQEVLGHSARHPQPLNERTVLIGF